MKHQHVYVKCEWIFQVVFIKLCFYVSSWQRRDRFVPCGSTVVSLQSWIQLIRWKKLLRSVSGSRLFLLSCPPPAALLPIPALFCQFMPRQTLWTRNQQETPQSISFIWQVSRIWQQQDEAAVWNLKRIKVLGENKNPSGSSYLIEKSGLGGEDYKDWTQQNHFKWPGNLSSDLLRRVCCPEARCYCELSLDGFHFKCISIAVKHRSWSAEF